MLVAQAMIKEDKREKRRRKCASKALLVNDGVSLVVERCTLVAACQFPFRTIGRTVSGKNAGDVVIATASAMLIDGKWWVPIDPTGAVRLYNLRVAAAADAAPNNRQELIDSMGDRRVLSLLAKIVSPARARSILLDEWSQQRKRTFSAICDGAPESSAAMRRAARVDTQMLAFAFLPDKVQAALRSLI